ncbi:MAG: iron-sulfur cluster assembly protein [Acidimicrobiales bacterium]|nr:iron-sulfur cluster assembly protein [Acidimicrobiales bacterium]
MSIALPTLEEAVRSAVAGVDDPEYPGVSIVDLGLLEQVRVDHGHVEVGLIPTFSGCPALAVIADEVRAAVGDVEGVTSVGVVWLPGPAWTVERVAPAARDRLATDFTVAVAITPRVACPRCGGRADEHSAFGPSRCRAVHRCTSCGEVVEVLRG